MVIFEGPVNSWTAQLYTLASVHVILSHLKPEANDL